MEPSHALDMEQLTAHVLQSIWDHLEEQGLAGFPERVAREVRDAGAGDAAPADLASITGHALESIWAHLEEQGLAGFPERIQRELGEGSASAGAAGGLAARLEELVGRVERLEARLARAESPAPAGLDRLRGRIEALERRLAAEPSGSSLGPVADDAELLRRVDERVAEALEERLGALDLETLRDRLLHSIRARLEEEAPAPPAAPDLRKLADEVYRRIQVRVRAAIAEASTPSEATLERITSELEQRLAAAPAAAPAPALDEALLERVAAKVEHMAVGPVLKAIDKRLARLADEGAERLVAAAARKAAESLGPAAGGASSGEERQGEGKPSSGLMDRRFVALAREVKTLKEAVESGGAAPGGIVTLLDSREFKELFDAKIQQVLQYVRTDAVPRAVRDALQET